MSKREGLVVAAYGRHYDIVLEDDHAITGFPKGKKSLYACGDRAVVELEGHDQGRIVEHLPRTTLLLRSDAYRQKLIAANATQLIFVVATEPAFSDELLARALVAAEHEHVRCLIVLNKCDLRDRIDTARSLLHDYAELGYAVIELSARNDASPLLARLANETSVLIGQSGMGKSTLVNALIPDAQAATREISTALDSGKHTTTFGRLYRTPRGDALIDCPGLQEFGLAHMSFGEIEHGFVELRQFLGQCRFNDCRHREEPGCAVKAAVASGTVSARRLELFQRITA